jgi:hypothetical protein
MHHKHYKLYSSPYIIDRFETVNSSGTKLSQINLETIFINHLDMLINNDVLEEWFIIVSYK